MEEKNTTLDDGSKEEKLHNARRGSNRYFLRMIIIVAVFLMGIAALFIYVRSQIRKATEEEAVYERHYAFIGKSMDSYTTAKIFEEAESYGKRNHIYVESIKQSSNVNYSDADYVKMATAMKVDGIILEASDDETLRESVSAAEEEGIPTLTMLTDCVDSGRICFLELGSYNLGREYGRVIINITKTRTPKVKVILDLATPESNEELLRGLRETLKNEGNHLDVEITTEAVDGPLNFRVMDLAREILGVSEEKPDILICTNAHDTELVYQAIKDYNLTGSTRIIGAGISDSTLNAIRGGEITAVVDVDAQQVGEMSIDLLLGYERGSGIANHAIAEDTVVTADNVERYLADE